MEDRKRQLEAKKLKLAEMKARKALNEESKKQKLLEHLEKRGLDPSMATSDTTDAEMEKILLDVGIEASPPRPKDASAKNRDASPAARTLFSSSRPATLSVSVPTQVNIAPKESVAYSKTTQTTVDDGSLGRGSHGPGAGLDGGTPSQDWWEDEEGAGLGGDVHGHHRHSRDEEVDLSPTAGLPPGLAGLVSNLVRSAEGGGAAADDKAADDDAAKKCPDLSEEEKAQVMATQEFQTFFHKSTALIERAMADPYDEFIFRDMVGDSEGQRKTETGARLSQSHVFTADVVRKRPVSGLDFSEAHPELVAVAYGDNPDEGLDGGLILVWNTKFPKKASPEFVFHSTSRVTAVSFSRFHPHLVIAGTYSGQICVWDNRQNKRTPVQRSPLSSQAHTHPVFCLRVVGTQNAHNLVSLSKDGRLCTWSLDMLAQPLAFIDLTAKQSRQVAGQCLDFPLQDVNNFLVGAEDGGIYAGCRHGTKPGVTEAFEPHHAVVTSLKCHRAGGQVDFSHLFLTASFDWSLRLYSTKEAKPLHLMENHSHFVMDVGWSPVHPALFAACDGTGLVEVWDLGADTELPVASVHTDGRNMLTHLIWAPGGHQLLVGDTKGCLFLFDVHETLATPKTDAWTRLGRTLMDLKQAQVEAEELSEAMGAPKPAYTNPTTPR